MNKSVMKSIISEFFIICILLSLILCTGCISEHSSSNNPSNTDVIKGTRFLNFTNGIYSINATVPVVTGKIMTYTVVKPNYSHDRVSSLAKKLGMSGEVRETPEAYFAEGSDEEKFIFAVFRNENKISFENRTGGSSGAMTDDEAKSVVKEFLKSADLMPPDASELRVSGYNTVEGTSSTGQQIQISKQIVVTSSRIINQIPEWDSTMMVTVGSHGNVVGFFMVWPDYQSYKAVSLKSPELAFKEFQAQEKNFVGAGMPINPEKIIVTNVFLGYSTAGGKYLQPVYLFSGYGQQGDQIRKIDPLVKIPACSEALE
jgi:hypothetical protein